MTSLVAPSPFSPNCLLNSSSLGLCRKQLSTLLASSSLASLKGWLLGMEGRWREAGEGRLDS